MKWIIYSILMGFSDPIHDIEVVSKKEALIYTYGTGKVFRTSDAGNSWRQVANVDSVFLEQIEMIDRKDGWIIGEHGRMLTTKDGGKSWNVDTVKLAGCDHLLIYGLSFFDRMNGVASGGCLNGQSLQNKMLITTDGGITWSEQNSVKSFIYNIEKNGNDVWATSDSRIGRLVNNNYTAVFADSTRKTGQVRDIEFAKDVVAAVSFNGYVVSSRDRGATWNSVKITNNRLRSIRIYGDTWIAAGDANKEPGTMHVSIDGGLTWKIDETISGDIHRLFKYGHDIWAVGKSGFIAKAKVF